MEKTHWLVDLENVGSNWRTAVGGALPGDEIHLFYSNKTVKIDIQDLGPASAKGIRFSFHECDHGLPNAMDFQMMCALGMLAATEPDARYVMFTADRGFSSVTGYMARHGVRAERAAPDNTDIVPDVPETAATHAANANNSVRAAYRKALKDAGVPADDIKVLTAILMEAMRQPQNKRKLDCRNRILKRWGRDAGTEMYAKLKPLVHGIAANGPFPCGPGKKTGDGVPEDALKAILASARKTRNPDQSLRDQLAAYYDTKEEAAQAAKQLKNYL